MTIYGARVECVVGSFAVSKSHCVGDIESTDFM